VNPELQRHLWLDATPRRLTWAGVGVLVAFVVVWLIDRGRHAYAATLAGAVLFFAAGLIWAPRAARRSATREVLEGTWDFQRLTALSPWTLTWGKLAGATLRSWVVAAGGLLIAALQLASTSTFSHALFWLMVAAGLGVTLQASGLATGLLDIRRARASGRPLSARSPGLLMLALMLLTFGALTWARLRLGHGVHTIVGYAISPDSPLGAVLDQPLNGPVSWFGHSVPLVRFAAFSLLMCAGWALVWAWRLMRLELQLANAPWAWSLFVLGAATYALGFDPSEALGRGEALAARLVDAGLVLAALAYVGAFAEPADRVRTRQFAAALAERDLRLIATRLPLIVWPSLLAVAAGLLVALIHAHEHEGAEALFALALLAFFVRDLGVIAWRRFARAGAPSDLGVAASLIALYLLGGLCGELFGGHAGLAAFLPSQELPGLSAVMGLIEAAAFWALAAYRISRPTRGPPRRAAPRALRHDAASLHPSPQPTLVEGEGEGELPAPSPPHGGDREGDDELRP
jgi:hypothetical protein